MKGSKFLDHVREVIRTYHLSYSTEKTYVGWFHWFIIFHNQIHLKDIDFELDVIIILGGIVLFCLVVLFKCGIINLIK